MKHLILYSLVLVFMACNSKNESTGTDNGETETPMQHAQNGTTEDEKVISDEDIQKFQSVGADLADEIINTYLKIKDALVNTNGEEAKEAAESIREKLEAAEGEGISLIRQDMEYIASTQSVEHQREHFNTLSKHVYALAKSTDAETKLYRQYCPMAFNNTGAFWLSSSEEILNPYFGDRMLKCGQVQETL